MFGVTNDGNSIAVQIHGFTPYFYIMPPSGFRDEDIPVFMEALESRIAARNRARVPKVVLAAEIVPDMQSLLGYHGKKRENFLKIYVVLSSLIAPLRTILENGFSFGSSNNAGGGMTRNYLCFEANIPFPLRFMIDMDIVGCNWIQIPAGSYLVRSASKKQSGVQYEVDVVFDDIISHKPDGDWQKIAPFRILSFDIECMGRKGHFPEAEHDPVIQIANVVTVQGATSSIIRNIFTVGQASPIAGADLHCFETEKEMLSAWAEFLRRSDPDVITGYNVQNFDIPYLLKRMGKLNLEVAQHWGRVKGVKATMRDSTFQSSAYGKRENVETTIDGRIVFDMLQYVRREHKLSSYSLNAVSAHFLGQQKEDVHHSMIATLQMGTNEDRRRLAVYCLKDAYLPQKIMDKLLVMINFIEMARVTGVPLDYLLTRGQQIKVMSMIYRKCRLMELAVPTLPRHSTHQDDDEVGYEGATVIEPMKGYYDEPIATLDFASLYPSIMMAHNLCYSTLIAPSDYSLFPEDIYEKSPDEDIRFVKASVQKGVLPLILEELLSARKKAKNDMAKATDPFIVSVQNGRQLALKISANSVYGFTGATIGQLPCLQISSTVTSYGRNMISDTKRTVEERFTIANGYPANALVVYGDTDSVMVKFGVPDVPTAMKLGSEAAALVTQLFPRPVKLEFEKVYFPFLLMNKKRYAGLYWSKPTHWDKMDTKGIETVRRDNCALVRKVVDTVLRTVLMERSVPGAVNYCKEVIADLLQNKIDISMLVITKALGKGAESDDYKAKQAHVELAERMRKRDPGSAPSVGDRVPYVIMEAAKGVPAYEKSEDPLYVLENNLSIDNKYYLEHQLKGPLERIFEGILTDAMMSDLFLGEHTRTIVKPTPKAKAGSIMSFAVKKTKCMACKVGIDESEGNLCVHCKHKETEVYLSKLQAVNNYEERYSQLWTQCQQCQGSLHADVICSARDCAIFYQRKKIAKDLKDVTDELSKFDLGW
jgi:DNA polymerase delta subunit 1